MIQTLNKENVFSLLVKEGFPSHSISLSDEDYAIPTPCAISEFGGRLFDFLKSSHLDTWVDEVWDCDDFAFTAKALASIDNAMWKKQTSNEYSSIAFGIAWVQTDEGGHAINIAILKEEDKYVVKYFEPQIQDKNLCLKELSRDSFPQLFWCYL